MELIIIAAGNGKRMGNINIPKVLYPVNGVANLDRILTNAIESDVFDTIQLVIKDTAHENFKAYLNQHEYDIIINLIPINSGLGDGHAILTALDDIKTADDSVIVWGDVYIDSPNIFKELYCVYLKYPDNNIIVPVVREKNPYVTLLTDENMDIISADFSKFGETHSEGLHDQSIFLINKLVIHESLILMHQTFWKNGQYITASKELNFLHVFHYLWNIKNPAMCYITEYPTRSFNSIEEVRQLEKLI